VTRDLIVVSDLHLGRGRDPATGRYHALEAFFYDDDLRAFCRHLCEESARHGRGFELILNGDALDLLRVEPEAMSTDGAARIVRDILLGHPEFVAALADVVKAGHGVTFLPGNHDLALQRDDVQGEIRGAVARRLVEGDGPGEAGGVDGIDVDVGACLDRIRFEPWFHHEPGRIWIEHGSQYDPEGAFRFLLRGRAAEEDERDLPLGNFFQRHLYNAFGPITFLVPSSEANESYFRWLVLHRPRDLARIAARHLPFVVRLLRRMTRRRPSSRLAEVHRSELDALAERSRLGSRLHAIDELKQVNDVAEAFGRMARRFARVMVGVFLLLLLGAGLWSAGNLGIAELRVSFGLKAALSLTLSFLMLAVGGAGLIYLLLRVPTAPRRPLPRAAQRIAELVDVPIVAFGHTHEEAVAPLERPGGGRGWYFNTGTWIGVFFGDQPVPRDPVQLTYLHVVGTHAELMHFCRASHRPRRAVVLDR
jgi:UDP-2,3-diacylglucosamine pyrophosphatase LpxH